MNLSEDAQSGLTRRTALTRVGLAGAGVGLAAGAHRTALAQTPGHPLVGVWVVGDAADPVGEQVAAFLAEGLVLVSAVETSNSDTFGTWTAIDDRTASIAMVSISRDPQGDPVRLSWSGRLAVDDDDALSGSVAVVARDGKGTLTDLGTLDFVGTRIVPESDTATPGA